MLGWSGKFPDDPKCPKFGTSIVSTAYGAYLDHADAQNLAKPPFMRICREFENWRYLRAIRKVFATKILLSGKFSLFATLHIILSQKDLKCRILLGYLLIERQSSFWLFPFQLQRQLCETSPSPNWNSECRLSPLSLKGWRWIFYNSLFLRAGEEKSER